MQKELKKRNILQTPTISLIEFSIRYLDYSKTRYSAKTYAEKRIAFKKLLKSITPELSIEYIHKGDILEHLRLQFKTRSGNAANKDRKNLIAAWNWGVRYLEGFP